MQPSLLSLKESEIPLNPFRIQENKMAQTTKKMQNWIQAHCPLSMREAAKKSENVFTLTKIALDGILHLAIQRIRPDIYKDIRSYPERIEFDENDFVDRITSEPENDVVEISEHKVEESKYKQHCWEDDQLARWYKNPSLFWTNR